jgi:predicted nucleotidyltransferase
MPPMGPVDPARLARLGNFFTGRPDLGVVSLYLFGSQAEDRAHRESDVDLAVLFDWRRYPTAAGRFDARLLLISDAMSLLGTNDVDLVILNDLPPLFARHILFEGRRLYVSDEAADRDFLLQTQLIAADLAPWLERMRRLKLEALAR